MESTIRNYSPIRSPKKSVKSSYDGSLNDQYNLQIDGTSYDDPEEQLPPPPSYRSASSATSRYSSIMEYLDDISVTSPNTSNSSSNKRQNYDDMSSVSNSSSRPFDSKSASRSSKSKPLKYIWDDLPADGNNNVNENSLDNIDETATYFSIISQKDSNKNSNNDDLRSEKSHISRRSYTTSNNASSEMGNSSTMHNTVLEVSAKVQTMQSELKQKNETCKQLQTELVRLKTAHQRRVDKTKAKWEAELSKLKDSQSITIKKQSEFMDKLKEDVSNLKDKQSALEDKWRRLQQSEEQSVTAAKEDIQRKRQRAKRQLESEEKQYFEKIAVGKSEAMRKAAADSMAPRLEKLVTDGKEAVRAKEELLGAELRKLRRKLEGDVEVAVTEAADKLRSYLSLEEARVTRGKERRDEDRLRLHLQELEELKDRYARERRSVEEEAERVRRVDMETALEAKKGIRSQEVRQLQEELMNQQREINTLIQTLTSQRLEFRAECDRERTEWLEQQQKKQQLKKEEKRNAVIERVKTSAAAETEQILQRIRDESVEERSRLQSEINNELNELREKGQERIDAMNKEENRLLHRLAQLREEKQQSSKALSELQLQLNASETTRQVRQSEWEALTSEAEGVRKQLMQLEAANNSNGSSNSNSSSTQDQRDKELIGDPKLILTLEAKQKEERQLQVQLEQVEINLKLANDRGQNEITALETEFEDELLSIRQRVTKLLRQKEAVFREHRQRLAELQDAVRRRGGELETVRMRQFGQGEDVTAEHKA